LTRCSAKRGALSKIACAKALQESDKLSVLTNGRSGSVLLSTIL
jgi:hypothetical protein